MSRAVRVNPLTLLELTIKRSIVSLLSKPQWWRKWQDPAIQTKWLNEIQLEFLHQTLQQHLKWDPYTYYTLNDLMQIQQMPPSPEKDALAAEWLAVVRYENVAMNPEWDGCGKGKNAYASILWYFTYAVLRDTLHAIPVREWTAEGLEPLIEAAKRMSDPRVLSQSKALAHSVIKNGSSDGVVKDSLAGVESRPEAIEFLRSHCHTILEELVCVRSYITQVINQIAKSDDLHVEIAAVGGGDAGRVVMSPTGVHGSWISDNLIPAELKARFVREVALLENVPDAEKDWHPNTNNQVLDLIHPSLYCCVKGKTKQVAKSPQELEAFSSPATQMAAIVLGVTKPVESEYFQKRDWDEIKFQWIPSDFLVREDGSVRILSYINNLHPANYASMYTSIEGIFARFVPLFERTLSALGAEYPKPVFYAPSDYNADRPKFPNAAPDFSTGASANITLKGKTVQVIVKVAEILLTPESPKYNGGSWHIEGTDAEQIVATGIYYFGSENIKESRLSFRVNVDQPEYEQSDDSGVAVTYGLFNDELLAQQVGSVTTLEDRCLVFPNILQHKVEPFELNDLTVLGTRKILAFFLVDPEKTIPSTSVIPPQQQHWIDAVQEPILKKLKLIDAAQQNVKDMMSGDSMTLEQAKEYRLELMEMRSAAANPDPDDYESYFSLCEH
uniref:DUF4246 domain-containing protein n=1 Tax=Globisporangium ultimum (strain ATCC 200006 / CBS 805.95 / DAOM BR144) TaxID=431595 RepID=K3W8K9_GLOUD